MIEEHSPSLREALAAAMAADEPVDTGATVETEAPAPDAQDTDGPARGADGKFAKAEAPADADDYDEGFGVAREHWAASPAEMRAKAREASDARKAADERIKGYEPLERVLSGRRDALRATWGDEGRAVEQLFHLSDWAGRDMGGFLRHMAQQSGFDLASLAPHAAPQQPGYETPADIRNLIRQEAARVAQEAQVTTALQAFEGNTAMEFRAVPAVRQLMGAILNSEIATDYATAYEMAVKAHPETSAKLRERESADAAKQTTEEAARRATAKASAAVSIRGAPGTASAAVTPAGHSSIRASLEAAMQQEAGRV